MCWRGLGSLRVHAQHVLRGCWGACGGTVGCASAEGGVLGSLRGDHNGIWTTTGCLGGACGETTMGYVRTGLGGGCPHLGPGIPRFLRLPGMPGNSLYSRYARDL